MPPGAEKLEPLLPESETGSWRAVSGAFQVRIRGAEAKNSCVRQMCNMLTVLESRLGFMPFGHRWRDVVERARRARRRTAGFNGVEFGGPTAEFPGVVADGASRRWTQYKELGWIGPGKPCPATTERLRASPTGGASWVAMRDTSRIPVHRNKYTVLGARRTDLKGFVYLKQTALAEPQPVIAFHFEDYLEALQYGVR